MERLERPDKHWKYNPGDVDERELWPKYMDGVPDRLRAHLDRRTRRGTWCRRTASGTRGIAVQHLLLEALEEIDPQWPAATFDVEAEKARLAAT